MPKTWLTIDSALREMIVAEGKTFGALAKETGVPAASLCRFVNDERGLNISSADLLFGYFDLVVAEKPKSRQPKRARGRR